MKGFGIEKVIAIPTSLYFFNCQLKGSLHAAEFRFYPFDKPEYIIMFDGPVVFIDSTFLSSADFEYAHFKEKVSFYNTSFNGFTKFDNASFNRDAKFGRTSFENPLSFWNVIFNGPAHFNGASFNGGAIFFSAIFNGIASFDKANVNKFLAISGAKFKNEAKFTNANINGDLNSIQTEFEMKASFINARVNGYSAFSNSIFKREADFSNVSFVKQLYLETVTFDGLVSFWNARFVDGAIFMSSTFANSVDLRLTRYTELLISWSQVNSGQLDSLWLPEQEKDIVSWQGAYFRLIKNFKNIGDFKSADDAYYHYKYAKYMFCSSFCEKTGWWFKYLFMGLSCGYGVIPWRTIVTACILILSFTLAYFIKKDALEYNGKNQKIAGEINKDRNFWYCFYFSVVTFTTLGYGDFSPTGKFKYVAMTEGILGWLTMAFFLVALANVWIR